jgi:hypothetical protein
MAKFFIIGGRLYFDITGAWFGPTQADKKSSDDQNTWIYVAARTVGLPLL